MGESYLKSILTKIGVAILAIVLCDLFFLNYWVIKNEKLKLKNGNIEEKIVQIDNSQELSPLPSPSPTESSPATLTDSGSTSGGGTTTIIEKQTQIVIQTAQKEIFIPMGSGSIANKNWTVISGLEVEIDTSKYSGIESIRFEATIWPEGGNGRAYARVYNVTDNNPYVESEISSSSVKGSYQNSNSIPFPNISKTYGVQAKSDIENFPAHVENARIKITLK